MISSLLREPLLMYARKRTRLGILVQVWTQMQQTTNRAPPLIDSFLACIPDTLADPCFLQITHVPMFRNQWREILVKSSHVITPTKVTDCNHQFCYLALQTVFFVTDSIMKILCLHGRGSNNEVRRYTSPRSQCPFS